MKEEKITTFLNKIATTFAPLPDVEVAELATYAATSAEAIADYIRIRSVSDNTKGGATSDETNHDVARMP